MFSGIIESLGEVVSIVPDGSNIHITIRSSISGESYIDQSIAHNGVCLTVVAKSHDTHTVTAIHETLSKTNLGVLKTGDQVNLERSVSSGGRMDGHFVQGHVDTVIRCLNVTEEAGSHVFEFELPANAKNLVVDRGSVCLNGTSLTVAGRTEKGFRVAIIPYTIKHTNFNRINEGDQVNVEFDILGKYILSYLENLLPNHSTLQKLIQNL